MARSQPAHGADEPRAPVLGLVAFSAITVGCVPFVTVGLYARGMDTGSVMFFRALLALLVVVPVVLALRVPMASAWREGGRAIFLMAASIGTIQTWCYFRAIVNLPTSLVITLFFLYPLVTVVLQRIVYGTTLPVSATIACLLILAGAALTGSSSLTLERAGLLDLAIALVPPFTYAAYAIAMARYTARLPTLSGAPFMQAGSTLGFAAIALLGGFSLPPDADAWLRLVAVGVLGTAVHAIALAYALPRLGATGFSVVSSLELVTVVVLGVAILGEHLTPWQWLGVVLVLAGILVYRPGSARNREAA